MTIEQTKPRSVYTIATAGPYALRDSSGNPWPYVADGLTVSVIKDGVITDLIGAGWFTVAPASGTNGNLTLTAAALTAYAGGLLVIARATPIEQAWQATQGPREVGLAAQLDRLAMGLQDQAVDASGALRLADQAVPPAALTSGRVILFENGQFVDGPAPGDIVNAEQNAAIATTKANEIAAAAALSQSLFTQFGALYLGPKATAPTVDNAGGPIQNGAIYLNTANNTVFFRIAGTWQVASLANLGITATAAQINPLGAAFDNAFLGAGATGNLAIGANDFGNNARWMPTQTFNGVTCTRVGFGTDTDGLPYVDYSLFGTAAPATQSFPIYLVQNSVTPAVAGQVFTGSVQAQIIAGTPPADTSTGVRVDLRGQNASGVETEPFFSGAPTRPTVQTLSTCTATLANAATAQITCGVTLRVQSGVSVDFTVRIKGLQFDRGAARLAYPFKALSPAEARAAMGLTATPTEINRTAGVTAPIQDQLDDKQNNLGFTPIQQGGGTGMNNNKVYIGWTGSELRVQVDNNDGFGGLALKSDILPRIAAADVYDNGCYIFAAVLGSGGINVGSTYAGGNLRIAGLSAYNYYANSDNNGFVFQPAYGGSPAGSWLCCGYAPSTVHQYNSNQSSYAVFRRRS